MLTSIFAISLGATAGSVFRWLLSLGLNAAWPTMPAGTLAANLIGGYLVGLAVSFFAAHGDLSPEWRLLVITGFLGGLTTFSTFSAEVISIVQVGDYLRAIATISLHLFGSLLLTVAGIATYNLFK